MGYPRTKFNERDYSTSDSYPDVARHQQIPKLAKVKLYYIHTMLIVPLSNVFGMPHVNSAFRSPQLNAAVGSKSRQHMAGEAVDIQWPDDNGRVLRAFKFIEDEMFHQTGWCYLNIDMEEKRFKQIHWALPLSPDATPRKNPEKFWSYYNRGFHKSLPMEVHEWENTS